MLFRSSNIVGSLSPGFPAEQAGMQVEDRIIMVNGVKTKNMQDITNVLDQAKDNKVEMVISRDGQEKIVEVERQLSLEDNRYLVGFTSKAIKGNVISGIKNSLVGTIGLLKTTVDGFVMLITGQVNVDQLAGPVGVINAGVQVWDEGAKQSIWTAVQQMLVLGALISVNLGIFNLFPFPALDGGRILFTAIEGVRKKPVDPKIEGFFHVLGFVFLMGLMVFVLFNDLTRGFG